MEPSAMLIAAFEIQIGGPRQVGLVAKDGGVARSRLKPHVENVGFFFKLRPGAVGALVAGSKNRVGLRRVPRIGAVLRNELHHLTIYSRIVHWLAAVVAQKYSDRNTPHPLPR